MKAPTIRAKRVYEAAVAQDGVRVLVDRLWPRGIAKAALPLDLWAKEIAPSTTLRQWYHRDPTHFAEFRRRYLAELAAKKDELDTLRSASRARGVTLLTAAKDLQRSHVAVLREVLAGED